MTDKVILKDLHELGYCNRGNKAFFERHKIDWAEFVKNGSPYDVFLNTQDAMAENAVIHAQNRLKKEVSNGG